MSTQLKEVEIQITGGDNDHEMFRQLNDIGRRHVIAAPRDQTVDTGLPFRLKLRLKKHRGYEVRPINSHLYGSVAVLVEDLKSAERFGEVWMLHGMIYLNFHSWSMLHPQLRNGVPKFRARYNVRTRKGTFYLSVMD